MAGDVTVTFKGLSDLDHALRQLPEEMQAAPVRAALKAGARVIQDGMQRRAPRDPNVVAPTLAEDIGITTRVSNKKSEAYALIGPSKRVFYGTFQELGTSNHPAQPFMRPALDEDGQIAVSAMANELRRALERAAKRLAKKQAA